MPSRDVPTIDVVPSTSLTRRSALAAGAGALLAVTASSRPAFAAPARARSLVVGPGAFAGARTSRVLAAPARFELLGARDAPAGLQVRARARGGAWSRWVPLAVHGDHRPDTGTGERASDPVWFGAAHELQLRLRATPRGPIRLHLVSAGRVPRRRARFRSAHASAPPITPRAAWGADAVPPRGAPSYGQVQLAFVHHTVTANDYGPGDSAAIVQSIARYHRDVNGWNDVGYNFLVDRYGQVFEGRAGGVDQAVIGAQCAGYNGVSTGIAVLGTFSHVAADAPAMEALARLIGWKLSVHGVPVQGQVAVGSKVFERVSGHRDGYATSCPGEALYAQLPALRARAASFAGPVTARPTATLVPVAEAVGYGLGARFLGVVRRPDGTPAAGEAVVVEKRGASGWVRLARVATDGQGAYVAEVPWRATGEVRARVAGVTTRPVRVAVVPRLLVRTIGPRVRAGRSPLVRGSVRPGGPVVVVLERRSPRGTWVVVARVRARVRGTRWEARVPMVRPALYRVTARTPDRAVVGRQQVVRAVRRGRPLSPGGGASSPGGAPPLSGGAAAG